MAEAFGGSIKKGQEGKIRGIMVANNIPNITLQHFLGDTILLGVISKEETIITTQTLKLYFLKILS